MKRSRALFLAIPLLTACAGLTADQILADADRALTGACSGLTFLPNQVAICTGVQGAEIIANLINQFVDQHAQPATKAVAATVAAKRGTPKAIKINGLPAFAPSELAAALNEPKENAALVAFVRAGLAQAAAKDAGATDAEGG